MLYVYQYGSQCYLSNEQRSSSCYSDYHNPGDGDEAHIAWHGGSGEIPSAAILWKMEEYSGAASKEFADFTKLDMVTKMGNDFFSIVKL